MCQRLDVVYEAASAAVTAKVGRPDEYARAEKPARDLSLPDAERIKAIGEEIVWMHGFAIWAYRLKKGFVDVRWSRAQILALQKCRVFPFRSPSRDQHVAMSAGAPARKLVIVLFLLCQNEASHKVYGKDAGTISK